MVKVGISNHAGAYLDCEGLYRPSALLLGCRLTAMGTVLLLVSVHRTLEIGQERSATLECATLYRAKSELPAPLAPDRVNGSWHRLSSLRLEGVWGLFSTSWVWMKKSSNF